MEKEEYIDYLKSDDWRERRIELMEEANHECSICGDKATQLHRLNYNNLGFEEIDIDLIAVCNKCYKEIHNKEDDEYGTYGEW